FLDQLFGVDGSDAFDHAAAQILLDTFAGSGRGAGEQFGAELQAKFTVPLPPAFGGQPFTRVHRGDGTHDGHRFAMAFGFYLEDGKTILVVEEGDPLDQAGQTFTCGWRARLQSGASPKGSGLRQRGGSLRRVRARALPDGVRPAPGHYRKYPSRPAYSNSRRR